MASGFFNMMADLAKSQKKMKEFKEDPTSVMDRYELTKDQKRLLRRAINGKQHDFHKVVGDEAHEHFSDHLDGNICC